MMERMGTNPDHALERHASRTCTHPQIHKESKTPQALERERKLEGKVAGTHTQNKNDAHTQIKIQ